MKTPPTPPSPVRRKKDHPSCDFGSEHSPNYNPPGACKNHSLTYHKHLACPSWRWPKKKPRTTARVRQKARPAKTAAGKKTKRVTKKRSPRTHFPSLSALVDALPAGVQRSAAADELATLLSKVRL
jgi:hypothetical protein